MMHSHHSSTSRHLSSSSKFSNATVHRSTTAFANENDPQHAGFKTPSSSKSSNPKSTQRRAFGDISNKKPGAATGGNNNKSVVLDTQKPKSTTKLKKNTNSSVLHRHHKSDASVSSVLSNITNHKNEAGGGHKDNHKPTRNKKQVNFVLPNDHLSQQEPAQQPKTTTDPVASGLLNKDTLDSLDLQEEVDLDPIEMPAGRTWDEQQQLFAHKNEMEMQEYLSQFMPESVDATARRIFEERRRAREEEEARLEREGEELLQQSIQEMHRQDELNDQRYAEEMKANSAWDEESIDMTLGVDSDDDDDFLNVSF